MKKYTKEEKLARKQLRVNANKYKDNLPRETVLVRIDKNWHKALKIYAVEQEMTMSRIIDSFCEHYLGTERYKEVCKK